MAHSIPMKPCGSNDATGKKVLKPSGCYWGLTVDVEEVDNIIMVCLHVFETKKNNFIYMTKILLLLIKLVCDTT